MTYVTKHQDVPDVGALITPPFVKAPDLADHFAGDTETATPRAQTPALSTGTTNEHREGI